MDACILRTPTGINLHFIAIAWNLNPGVAIECKHNLHFDKRTRESKQYPFKKRWFRQETREERDHGERKNGKMRNIVAIVFVMGAFIVPVAVWAQETQAYEPEPWETTEIETDEVGAYQNVHNQAIGVAVMALTAHVQVLENQCANPDSGGCTQAIVAAEQAAQETVKTAGLSKKQRRAVRRMIDDAITAANIGDIEGVRKIRAQLEDHEKRLGVLEGDVKDLKGRVKKIEDEGGAVPQGADNPERVSAVAQAAVNKAEEALATAKAAQTAADEAKAQQADGNSEALDRANEAVDKANDALERAQEALDTALSPANDEEARRLAKQAMDAAQSAAQSADQALEQAMKVSGKLESEIAAIKAALDKKQDANEIEVGLGYFGTAEIFGPTVGFAYTIRRGGVRLALGVDIGYHFWYGDKSYEPEIPLLYNTSVRLSYQFVDFFSAGLGAFSYSAGQSMSDSYGFGLLGDLRFNWMIAESVGMAVELWGGPSYRWVKYDNEEPAGTGTSELWEATHDERGFSGAYGLRLGFDF